MIISQRKMTARLPRRLIRLLMREEKKESSKLNSLRTAFGIWERQKNDKNAPRLRNESTKKGNARYRHRLTQSENGPHHFCPHGLRVRQLSPVDPTIGHDDASAGDLRSASERSFPAASPSARVLFNQANYILDKSRSAKHPEIHKNMKSGGCDCWGADNSPSGLRLHLFPVNTQRGGGRGTSRFEENVTPRHPEHGRLLQWITPAVLSLFLSLLPSLRLIPITTGLLKSEKKTQRKCWSLSYHWSFRSHFSKFNPFLGWSLPLLPPTNAIRPLVRMGCTGARRINHQHWFDF